MIRLAVLGSTGSVGTQTLDVVKIFRDRIDVVALCAYRASRDLLLQAREFRPKIVVSVEEPSKEWLKELPKGTEYLRGEEGILEAIRLSSRVMNAISGVDGIKPAYFTLKEGRTLLASNKESVICLGNFIKENRRNVIPVDSEHNALFQLLERIDRKEIRLLYLTASGGPFKDWTLEQMRSATVEEALKHPRWNMGSKITVDSATLMNKGFETLEAVNLFDLDLDAVKVVIHPQSFVHGMVELRDNTFFMLMSDTDMRIPIQHALLYPERLESPFGRKRPCDLSPVTFEEVDTEKFRSIHLARWAGEMGGVYVPVLVGADEEAVKLFLEGKIGFLDIVDIIEETLSSVEIGDPKSIEEILFSIEWAREKVREIYYNRYAK